VLGAIARSPGPLPPQFVPNLLAVRLALAPAYARRAVELSAAAIVDLLEAYQAVENTPEAFAEADWHLHRVLTIASGNPVFTLILNGFDALYRNLAARYFASPEARAHSRRFYADLLASARAADPDGAEVTTRRVMAESVEIWMRLAGQG
jgi:GntR family negative regulator for fad regulon and positive regulator of fabA